MCIIWLIKLKIRETKHIDQRLHAHMEYCSFHVQYEKSRMPVCQYASMGTHHVQRNEAPLAGFHKLMTITFTVKLKHFASSP